MAQTPAGAPLRASSEMHMSSLRRPQVIPYRNLSPLDRGIDPVHGVLPRDRLEIGQRRTDRKREMPAPARRHAHVLPEDGRSLLRRDRTNGIAGGKKKRLQSPRLPQPLCCLRQNLPIPGSWSSGW